MLYPLSYGGQVTRKGYQSASARGHAAAQRAITRSQALPSRS